ncbi:MAG: hypothetical protein L3J19_02465 [Sulfurimonas sp.]|nr:hypothetical protein [Sulfurimonas sp.]
MQVTRYLFQSPYSSQVQVGRPDVSSSGEQKSAQSDSGLQKAVNQPLEEAQSFKETQVQEVEPTVKSDILLDIYA